MSKRVVWGLISTLLVLVIAVIVFVILTPNSTNDESDNITRINLEEDVKQVSVLGTIKEDAVEKAVVDNATMTIGTKTIDVSDGTYATDGVAEGTQTVKISSPNHDDFEAPFEIKSGINRITFILTLTPGETLRRWLSQKSLVIIALRTNMPIRLLRPSTLKRLMSKIRKIWQIRVLN